MKIVIHPDFMQTADFIKQLPQHFAQEGELLYEGRNEVRRYRVKNEWLVVKKYKQPNKMTDTKPAEIVYLTIFWGLVTFFADNARATMPPKAIAASTSIV